MGNLFINTSITCRSSAAVLRVWCHLSLQLPYTGLYSVGTQHGFESDGGEGGKHTPGEVTLRLPHALCLYTSCDLIVLTACNIQ